MTKGRVLSMCLILFISFVFFTGCVSQSAYNQTLLRIKTLENENAELKGELTGGTAKTDEKSLSYIKLDKEGRVSGWYNNNHGLSSVLEKKAENAPPIKIGSTKEEVVKALGAPTKIDPNFSSTWYYERSSVQFDNEGKVRTLPKE